MSEVLFASIVYGGLLTAPIGGWLAYRRTRGLGPGARKRWAYGATAALCLPVAGGMSDWSFRGVHLDGASVVLAYASYAFLLLSLSPALTRRLRVFVRLLAGLPVLAIYLAGTIGCVGVGVIILNEFPRYSERTSSDEECRIFSDGAAFSSGGNVIVRRYRLWPWAPMIERTIATETYERDEWEREVPYSQLCRVDAPATGR